MKKITTIATLGLLSLSLTGCFSSSAEGLLQAPKLPTDYIALQNQIDKEITEGKVQVSPESGVNRNTLQLIDIDADSEEEAIAFFRNSNISNEFEIKIYEMHEEEYEEVGTIFGEGAGISSVDYPRLSPIGGGGIAVSWSIGDKLQKGLTVVKYENEEITTMLETRFESKFILDIDTDGIDEIFIITRDGENMVLKMYRSNGQTMIMASSVELTRETDSISKITIGKLVSGGISIAIDSRVTDRSGFVTDFITYDEGKLINITLDETGSSAFATHRITTSNSSKLFYDDIIYVPTVTPMKDSDTKDAVSISYITNWHLFDNYNPTDSSLFTYHNTVDGWYFELEGELRENVVVNKSTISSSKITKISYYTPERNTIDLFEIYMIPKEDFNNDAFGNGYISLATNSTSVYVAKNSNPKNEFALTNDEIINNFNLITN